MRDQIVAWLIQFLLMLPVILLSLSVHELAHGWTSYRLGDSTAKYMGRLSLNPLRHIDPLGFLALLFFHVGWAKPVMVDPRYFKNPKRDMALVSLAGPLSNFLLAFLAAFVYEAMAHFLPGSGTVIEILKLLVYLLLITNLGLGVFNLIPIPPLDGSKILYAFLPDRIVYRIMPYELYIRLALLVLLWLGFLSRPIHFLVDLLYQGFVWLPHLLFGGIV